MTSGVYYAWCNTLPLLWVSSFITLYFTFGILIKFVNDRNEWIFRAIFCLHKIYQTISNIIRIDSATSIISLCFSMSKLSNHSLFRNIFWHRYFPVNFRNKLFNVKICEYTTKGHFSFVIIYLSTKLDLFFSLFYSFGYWPFVWHNKRQLKNENCYLFAQMGIEVFAHFFLSVFTHLPCNIKTKFIKLFVFLRIDQQVNFLQFYFYLSRIKKIIVTSRN